MNSEIISCDLLSPIVPDDYSCQNTFSFVSQVKNVSYDVTSLFNPLIFHFKKKFII